MHPAHPPILKYFSIILQQNGVNLDVNHANLINFVWLISKTKQLPISYSNINYAMSIINRSPIRTPGNFSNQPFI